MFRPQNAVERLQLRSFRRGAFSINGHGASITKGDTYSSSYA